MRKVDVQEACCTHGSYTIFAGKTLWKATYAIMKMRFQSGKGVIVRAGFY
jgi:hypothetical protein